MIQKDELSRTQSSPRRASDTASSAHGVVIFLITECKAGWYAKCKVQREGEGEEI